MSATYSYGTLITSPQESEANDTGNRHTRRLRALERWGRTPRTSDSTFPRFLEVSERASLRCSQASMPSSPRANVQHSMHAQTESDDERDRL